MPTRCTIARWTLRALWGREVNPDYRGYPQARYGVSSVTEPVVPKVLLNGLATVHCRSPPDSQRGALYGIQ